MLGRLILTTAVALLSVFATPTQADTPVYRWKTEKDRVCLLANGKVVYCYEFARDAGYPYLHPLGLPGGQVMTAFAPTDHPWHRGLWFSWKYLNGVNYWEFRKDRPNQPDGKTAVIAPAAIQTAKSTATVRLTLAYSKGQTVLTEKRELAGSLPRTNGSYIIDWKSTFMAKEKDVVFERTPPEKASWGGYGGLGFRASKTMRDFRTIDSEGRSGRQQAHGKRAKWMDFSGIFGGVNEKPNPAGITIFDHPSNPRHPTHWYLSDNAGLPYFGPALLFSGPLTLKAGESFTVRYRILVHPGLGNKAALEREYEGFAR